MNNTLLVAVLLTASIVMASGQDRTPANRTEAPAPAPPAQQNAPAEKLAPGPLSSPNTAPPDVKAETAAPVLKLDSGTDQKSPEVPSESRAKRP